MNGSASPGGAATPSQLAQQCDGRRVEPSQGPSGDRAIDEAITALGRSVERLLATESLGAVPARHPHAAAADPESAPGAPQRGHTEPSRAESAAGDVVARAHDAHETLQARLKQAQA